MKDLLEHFPTDLRLVLTIVGILIVTYIAVKIVNRIFNKAFSTHIGKKHIDQTSLSFIRRLISSLIYIIGISAAVSQIPGLKVLGNSLLAGAGIITLLGGLAAQQVLSNLISGVLIIFFRPFKIGDRISISSTYVGIVEDITLRETVLRDFENNRVIVPNSQISSQVLVNCNYTEERICKFVDIGIGYSSDVDKAMAIMAEEILNHPLHIDNRTPEQVENNEPVVVVRLVSLGDSSVNLRAWAWAKTPGDGFVLLCDVLLSIKRRFDQEGIEIPFPQRTISYAKGSN